MYYVPDGFSHFAGVIKWRQGLHFNMVNAAIPLKFLHPGQVKKRWGIAFSKPVAEPVTEIMIQVGKCGKLLVATGAGKITIFAQPAIIKQFSAQLKPFFR